MNRAQIFALLKALPMVRFALMLGGGIVATIGAGHVQLWLMGGKQFPAAEAVWLARIQGAVWMGLGSLLIVALVMVALTFGPAGKLGIKAPGGLELDLDFDKQDAPPREGDPS